MQQEEPELRGHLGPLPPCARSSLSRRPRRATGWGGWACSGSATVRRPPRNFTRPPLPTTGSSFLPGRRRNWTCGMKGEAARAAPHRCDLVGARRQPGRWRWSGCFDWLHIFLEPGLVGRWPPGVRPRPGAADGAAAGRPGPTAPAGRDVGGGCRADGWRRRGSAGRGVAGQRPGRPPDPTRPGTPPARARARRRACAGEAPRRGRIHRGAPRRQPEPGADGGGPPASAPTTSPASSRRPPGCRRTSTSSPAASSAPSSSCKEAATCPWRTSPRRPASPTRACSASTSSASSASRRDSSACPHESPNTPQVHLTRRWRR